MQIDIAWGEAILFFPFNMCKRAFNVRVSVAALTGGPSIPGSPAMPCFPCEPYTGQEECPDTTFSTLPELSRHHIFHFTKLILGLVSWCALYKTTSARCYVRGFPFYIDFLSKPFYLNGTPMFLHFRLTPVGTWWQGSWGQNSYCKIKWVTHCLPSLLVIQWDPENPATPWQEQNSNHFKCHKTWAYLKLQFFVYNHYQ